LIELRVNGWKALKDKIKEICMMVTLSIYYYILNVLKKEKRKKENEVCEKD